MRNVCTPARGNASRAVLDAAKACVDAAVVSMSAVDTRAVEEAEREGPELDALLDALSSATELAQRALSSCLTACDELEGHEELPILELRKLSDIAFVGRMGLTATMREARAPADVWARVDAIDRARRDALQSLRAADLCLCKLLRVQPDVSYYLHETAQAQAVRAAFMRFYRDVNPSRPPEADEVLRALRITGTALAILFGTDHYQYVRIHDRRQLRALQQAVRDWLQATMQATSTPLDGQRIWQDAASTAEMLMGVNKRPELMEADRLALTRLKDILAKPSWELREVSPILHLLRGRDEELDELASRDLLVNRESLVRCCNRVLQALGGQVSTSLLAALDTARVAR